MSLSSLRSRVSQLESDLRTVEAYNRELCNELSIVENGVAHANNTLESYNMYIQNTLDSSDNIIHSSHQKIVDSIAVQAEIERMYVRFKNIELANKKIRKANSDIYYDFANYRTVRKIVHGIMDNLDMNMVSDKAIHKAVEKQHLQSPDYWLTCVLISVMAWKNNDKELAERATAKAISFDKKLSAIFYMLFNLRMKRNDAAVKWFETYQECDQKGSDNRTFLVLFSLYNNTDEEATGEDFRNKISDYINNTIQLSRQNSGYNESEIITGIFIQFMRMQIPESFNYALLSKYCLTFGELTNNMVRVKNNINILDFILKTINVAETRVNFLLKNYVSEIIAIPNQIEQSTYEEIAYNEMIIKLDGNVDEAKIRHEVQKSKAANPLNLVAEMASWVYERDNQDITGHMRKHMFTLTKNIQKSATEAYAQDYRNRNKTTLPIKINDYAADVNFNQENSEIAKAEAFYYDIRDNNLSTIKDWPAYLGLGLAILAIVGGIALTTILFAVAAICIGYGVFALLNNNAQRRQLELACTDSIRTTTDILSKLFTEFASYQQQFNEYDAYHERIVQELV